MQNSFFESLGKSGSYTAQSQLMSPIPLFMPTIHERWFLTFKFMQNFFLGTVFITIFTMQLIIPQIELATDEEIRAIYGRSPEPLLNLGIGDSCLYELKQGRIYIEYYSQSPNYNWTFNYNE